jgi:hypothetical protein
VTLIATATGAAGHTVRWMKGSEVALEAVADADPFQLVLEVAAPGTGEARYRAEVDLEGLPRVITSHVWVRDEPADAGPEAPAPSSSSGDCDCRIGASRPFAGSLALVLAVFVALVRRATRANFRLAS